MGQSSKKHPTQSRSKMVLSYGRAWNSHNRKMVNFKQKQHT